MVALAPSTLPRPTGRFLSAPHWRISPQDPSTPGADVAKPDPNRHVGSILRKERESAGCTLADVGLYVQVSPRVLQQYEALELPPQHVVSMALSYLKARPLLVRRVERIYARANGLTINGKPPRGSSRRGRGNA